MRDKNIEIALNAIRNGEFVIVTDDENRENEGDLIIAAEKITPERMAFLLQHSSGVVCVALPDERIDELQLEPMVARNTGPKGTAFTVSVDLKKPGSTGISATERSATIRALADLQNQAGDFTRPGHVFPLHAKKHGVLERPGHTEAAVDLARLAGLSAAGVLCEITNADGNIKRGEALRQFAEAHQLAMISIAELIAYRRRTEKLVEAVSEARLPTAIGIFRVHVYRSILDGSEHLAIVKGKVEGEQNVLVRVHSECFTGDVLDSLRCDCGNQLKMALSKIEQAGRGVLVYLRGHEGRGIGLAHKLRAYELQDQGRDTVEANLELGLPVDSRSYDVGAQILTDLGITTLKLMSNNPAKFTELAGYRLKIVERIPLESTPNKENLLYLHTKSKKMGHLLTLNNLALHPVEIE
jgi:3,4-dihydroxy 2-butanone 4-phosphate synthase / GTP cyclohydrolase II